MSIEAAVIDRLKNTAQVRTALGVASVETAAARMWPMEVKPKTPYPNIDYNVITRDTDRTHTGRSGWVYLAIQFSARANTAKGARDLAKAIKDSLIDWVENRPTEGVFVRNVSCSGPYDGGADYTRTPPVFKSVVTSDLYFTE